MVRVTIGLMAVGMVLAAAFVLVQEQRAPDDPPRKAKPADAQIVPVQNRPPRGGGRRRDFQIPEVPAVAGDHGFRFVRIRYQSNRGGGWGGASWAFDWPTAEENLDQAIQRTTAFHLDGPPVVLTLLDDEIFDYPVLYLCEPGYWELEEGEAENLRRYLDRGGFIIIDDFHDYEGDSRRQWNNFYEQLKKVLPDHEPVEVPPTHPIWSIYYDIDPIEAPSTKDYEGFGKYDDRYYAVYDDTGRMMVMICYNQDIGDGWEWPDRNFENASTLSFQMAVNIITWAMTH